MTPKIVKKVKVDGRDVCLLKSKDDAGVTYEIFDDRTEEYIQSDDPRFDGFMTTIFPEFVKDKPKAKAAPKPGLNECPYCKAKCEATTDKRFFNGIRPIWLNTGCEFCCPLPASETESLYEEVNA